ncbi:IS4 family transposase [Blastopirellula marina]|uniref:IS4 family transposase n=1 Tax=Blastopirellula marina TaxID=124 RepID=A0A2S8F9Y8_9BACT|nr:IS4 family transposase [Blastopirellula marina]PQO28952.1 IS4 family transposase [Blastopirellula marina]PTL42225.1 IS4 family transposase [Blastopirellula marina]
MDAWVEREVEACEFPDRRLKSRLGILMTELGRKIGGSVPAACQDWAATKAAYRFFSNPRVDESIILAGHFAATQARFTAANGPVLVLHDTTEFSFRRIKPEAIGQTKVIPVRQSLHTICGLLMHSSLVVTPKGVPLGLAAIKFWTRKKFKGTNALKSKVNPTRVPIEQKESFRWIENMKQATEQLADPERCVHVGDRESDIYELFCVAEKMNTQFLVRTCVDRLAGLKGSTISRKMQRQPIRGEHAIELRDNQGKVSTAKLRLRFCRMTVHPPIGKQKRWPSLSLTVVHAQERSAPAGREPICWKLLTNLPVEDLAAAIEKLDWYAQGWKIETFHKVLKSGCQAEQAKLRSASRLTNLLAMFCILAWRVFWLTMVNRTMPEAAAETVLTTTELQILEDINLAGPAPSKPTLNHYLTTIAKLGGYLARGKDPPPGNMVIWRGLSRLTDIHLGFELRGRVVGN